MIDVTPEVHLKNLEWILASPALLNAITSKYAPKDEWFTHLVKNYENHLNYLRSDPTQLITFLKENIKSSRLGAYFEILWRYWFSTNEEYELLYNNLQIFDNNRTIGEFDFIVLNNNTNKTEHWEVALKFYLQKNQTSINHSWLGPNKIDRLDIKLDKLINSQILLSTKSAATEQLKLLKIDIESKKIILKGRLFYSNSSNKNSNPGTQQTLDILNPQHENSSWYYYSDFLQHEKFSKLQWCTLSKLNWLSRSSQYNNYILHSQHELEVVHKPICIAGLQNSIEKIRLFIVPEEW